jgi:hypothetical protein
MMEAIVAIVVGAGAVALVFLAIIFVVAAGWFIQASR